MRITPYDSILEAKFLLLCVQSSCEKPRTLDLWLQHHQLPKHDTPIAIMYLKSIDSTQN